ncbi:MAG: type II secretion system major pseudopilin GspG [Planctomycetota bacterium]
MTTARKQRRRRGGFTLIEVLLVLTILVIIASLAVVAYGPIQRSAYIKAADTQIKAFKTPLQAYRLDIGDFPSTSQGLEGLLAAPSDLANPDKWFGPYLDSQVVPKDPWGNVYQYEYPSKNQELWPDIWSFGPDGQDGTDDDVGNWMIEE